MFKGSLKQANGYGWIRKEQCGGKKGGGSLRKDRKKWGEEGNQKEKWEDGRDEKKRLRSK